MTLASCRNTLLLGLYGCLMTLVGDGMPSLWPSLMTVLV